jgi:quinol monooxygenase YgiN
MYNVHLRCIGVNSRPWLWPCTNVKRVTFANAGTLGAAPGRRDELVAHLTQRSEILADLGCLAYEVGVNADEPDTVFVVELWESAEAHHNSLTLPEVRASIEAARPMLSGEFGGFRFDVVGSPLRD